MVKIAHTMSFTNKPPQKKQAIFTVLGHVVEAQRLPESCQLHLQNWRSIFLVATTVTLSIAFLPPIGDTCKSHVNVHGRSDKIYHQLMATQVKFPRKSLATEAVHSLRHALQYESRPKTLGANFEHFWVFVGPDLLINARTLTSGY
jgi:hypothetical protein